MTIVDYLRIKYNNFEGLIQRKYPHDNTLEIVYVKIIQF